MKCFFVSLAVTLPFACSAISSTLGAEDAAFYVKSGRNLFYKGDFDKAIAAYDQALQLDPKCVDAYISRALVWTFRRPYDYDKAITDLTQALRLDPKSSRAYDNRAVVWKYKGEYGKAISDYNQAIRFDPVNPMCYVFLAWLQATCPDQRCRDGKKAVENAKKGYDLTNGKDCQFNDTLAAAYAESGDFSKAREWEVKAIEVLGAKGAENQKQELRSRLELYKQNKPYHEEVKK